MQTPQRLRLMILAGGWLLVLVGIGLRFYELDERGTTVSDAIYYTNIAQSWADGEPIHRIYNRPKFYRPVPYALFGWGLRIFGSSDASIKYVNAGLDSLSVFLIFAIAWLVVRDALVAVAAAASYALLPMALLMSRIEFVHVSSTTMILLSLLLYLLHLRSRGVWARRGWLFLCGAATGLAALTHEELLLLAFPYSLLLLASKAPAEPGENSEIRWRPRAEAIAMNGAVYGLGLALVCRSYFHHFFRHGVALHSAGAEKRLSVAGHAAHRFARFLGDSIIVNSSVWVLVLWIAVTMLALAFMAYRRIRGRSAEETPASGLVPAFLVVVHMLVFSRFFDQCLVRVVFPMTPLVLLGVVFGLSMLVPGKWRSVVVIAAVLGMIWSNIGSFGGGNWWSERIAFSDGEVPDRLPFEHDVRRGVRKLQSAVYAKNWSRQVFDLLDGKVDADSRLLVTPAIVYSNLARRVLQLDYYFGDDAIYVADHSKAEDGGLESLAKVKHIRYVLFTTFGLDPRLRRKKRHEIYLYNDRWRQQDRFVAGALYGLSRREYTVEKEWEEMSRWLEERGAKIVGASKEISLREVESKLTGPRFFIIFELPPRG